MQQNLGKMLKGLGDLQKKMDAIQKELAESVFEGSAVGGMVKVSMTGKGELKQIVIDPAVMSEDAETVADLVVVASRKAYEAKELAAKQKLGEATSGVLPFGLKMPGLG